jgi:hypothetical protein
MRWRLMPILVSVSTTYTTAAWEATVSQNLQVPVAQSQAINSVTLSKNSFQGGPASGTAVEAIGVTMSPVSPSFPAALSLGRTNASNFQIVGGDPVINSILTADTYQINRVATRAEGLTLNARRLRRSPRQAPGVRLPPLWPMDAVAHRHMALLLTRASQMRGRLSI